MGKEFFAAKLQGRDDARLVERNPALHPVAREVDAPAVDDSYVRLPVLQPLYERSQLKMQLKMRRVLPAGLFVAPLVFSSTGVFLESTLRPLLVRFADDDDILQEMSERRFMPQLSTAVQRGWVYRYGRMLRNLSGSEDRDRLAPPLGGKRYGPPTCAGPHGPSNER